MSDEVVDVENRTVTIVDKATGEIIESKQTPDDLMLAAAEAAKALEKVIMLNERPPVMFNGRRYLEFHHWQVLAKFYHVTARTFDATPIEIGGVTGFKAKAEAVDEKTGQIVGSAEAYCLRDEPNWKTKPTFQLASMAQTRAASKALSNKFRFVAIVAGYEGTPSEEMTADTMSQRQVAMPKKKAEPIQEAEVVDGPYPVVKQPTRPVPEAKPSKFFTMIHAEARKANIPPERMKTAIKSLYGKDSSKDLTDKEASDIIKLIQKGGIR